MCSKVVPKPFVDKTLLSQEFFLFNLCASLTVSSSVAVYDGIYPVNLELDTVGLPYTGA